MLLGSDLVSRRSRCEVPGQTVSIGLAGFEGLPSESLADRQSVEPPVGGCQAYGQRGRFGGDARREPEPMLPA